jgi:hypothetical protein
VAATLKGAALRCRERGWSVIPIEPGGKKPLIPWAAYQTQRATVRQIRRWWTQWPDANVGIVCGEISGLAVADFDARHKSDVNAFLKDNPTARVVRTGSGGWHLYYQHPGRRVPNQVSREGGYDVRGDGGFVVAPPSRHANGRRYEWTEQGKIGPYPADLTQLSVNGKQRDGHAERWLEKTLGGVSHGLRNDACARLAGYYLSKQMPLEVIREQLLLWNERNDPPLEQTEVERTLRSVTQTQERRGTGEDEGYTLIGWNQYLAKYGAVNVEWLVRDWLPDASVAMTVAPPGSFKTWLLQDLAVSVASGQPFLGQFTVERPGPVLFMQQEDSHPQIAKRFALITYDRFRLKAPYWRHEALHIQIPPELPIYFHEYRRFRFDDQALIDSWVEVVEKLRPRLVVLDPLYSAGSVDDFMAGTARQMFLFKSLRDRLGTTFQIAHHTGKREDKSKAMDRERLWGSQFLNAWIEAGWQVRRRDEQNTAEVFRHFKSAQEAAPSVIKFDIDTEVRPARYAVTVRDLSPADEKEPHLLATLADHGPMTRADLARQINRSPATISRRISNLIRAGEVAESSDGVLSLSGTAEAA